MKDNEMNWESLRRSLTSFVRKRVSSAADAEDIVQEVLLRHFRHQDGIQAEKTLPWLYRVARNAVTDHYRAKSSYHGLLAEAGAEKPFQDIDSILNENLSACLPPLLKELPLHYADAVRLADLEGLRQEQVAQRLGLALSGAKSRIQRGRSMLRKAMERCCRIEWDRQGNVIAAKRIGPGPVCPIAQTALRVRHLSICEKPGLMGRAFP